MSDDKGLYAIENYAWARNWARLEGKLSDLDDDEEPDDG